MLLSVNAISTRLLSIKQELQWFKDHGVRLKILDLPTSMIEVPEGQTWILEMIQNILIEVLASIAEQERVTIRKRQREGIDAARLKGKHLGRLMIARPEGFEEAYDEWKRGTITAMKASQMLGLSNATFYRMAKQYENESKG